jgi:23S rRNA (guanine2445-N2)-methyltransferase / 23S rRNA (guanine2069-N7)-methyltransferase
MAETFRFFVTTAKGMEPLLVEELASIGIKDALETRAGASFQGTLESAYRVCLWSRIANRVLLQLKTFEAHTPEHLYQGIQRIRWQNHMKENGTLAVDFSSAKSAITHTHFGALKVKDGIVDQFRAATGIRPSVNTDRPDLRINVYLSENQAQVSLDLSGDSLHMRGYREEGSKAPLKENLAATILWLAKWREVAAQGGAFIDPMCGSGTLPIEAAWIAMNRAPGVQREYFGFLGWLKHDAGVWQKLVTEARAGEILDPKKLPTIVGYDSDFRSVNTALANIERAQVRGIVHVEKKFFSDAAPVESFAKSGPKGLIVLNPPYGERLGEIQKLMPLYQQMGDVFKQRFKGWEGYIFTGSPELSKNVGLKPSRRHVLYNGPIECRLFKYELF